MTAALEQTADARVTVNTLEMDCSTRAAWYQFSFLSYWDRATLISFSSAVDLFTIVGLHTP